ncbi:helix-turn-helix transcriptional regulator [Lolliginicoccus levis]|uniref:helix-turn-helix transcriptional regulator n=1 Tax=Lolliginicoccus levis TaxID=2919542 RepID=UPI00241FCB7F|nr:WYL domain-containing protein [Lolliginicoccus levis]
MAAARAERLVNLVIALLSTRQFLTADQIRETVAGYPRDGSDDAYYRMFERDKAELRDLGIPLETGRASWHSTTEGYRIRRDAYELPDVQLDQDEAAAVAVAAQLWQSPELHAATQAALLKLRAGGVPVIEGVPVTMVPQRARTSEQAVRVLLEAIDSGTAVRFEHRGSAGGDFLVREVEPWGIGTWRGRWYLVGRDRDKQAVRTFRLSRIAGEVTTVGKRGMVRKPEDVDIHELIARAVASGTAPRLPASVWVASGRVHELRRMASASAPHVLDDADGDLLEVEASSWEWLARAVAGHGPDAVAMEPPELVREVVAVLEGALRAAGGDR